MAKALDKMNVAELIKEIGMHIPALDLAICFKDEKIQEEVGQMAARGDISPNNILNFLLKHEKELDKSNYIFLNYLYYTGTIAIDEIDINTIPNRQARVEKMKKFLIQHPVVLLYIEYGKMITKTYDSRDYTNEKQKGAHQQETDKALERMTEIENECGLNYFLLIQILTDPGNIYVLNAPNSGIGDKIRSNTIAEAYRDTKSDAELLELLVEPTSKDEKPFLELVPYFKTELIDSAEYVDWDKFLMLSAYRAKRILEMHRQEEFGEGEAEMLIKIMQTAKKLVKKSNTKIQGNIELQGGSRIDISYTYKELSKDLETKVIDGRYYGTAEIEKIKNQLFAGEISVLDICNKKIFDLINLSKEEKQQYMELDMKNAIDLFRNGIITQAQLKSHISNSTVKAETLMELKDIYTSDEILKLYMQGHISFEEICKIKPLVQNSISERRLAEEYKKLKEASEDEKEKIERYISLYREIRISEVSDDKKRDEIGNNIILELDDDLDENDFYELYRRNLITLNTVIDWRSNGETEDIAIEMFVKGILKPSDAKKIIEEGKLKSTEVRKQLANSNLSDEEKMALIFSTFNDESQREFRKELFQALGIEYDERNYSQGEESKNESPNESTNESADESQNELPNAGNTQGYDPCYKMQLLELIDKDYTYKLTKDGHIILELPRFNDVIIERMFRKTKNGIGIATGAATYFVSMDKYKSLDIVTSDDKVKRTQLTQMSKTGNAERRYHTKNWGDMICERYGMNNPERYSEKDRKEREEVVAKLVRSRNSKEI